jgi:hypothetical protein
MRCCAPPWSGNSSKGRPQRNRLTAYAFACARGGLRDPASVFTDGGTLLWTTRNPDQLEAFEGHVVEIVQHVRRREFAPRPDPGRCGWCEFRTGCPDGVTGSGLASCLHAPRSSDLAT